MKLTSLLLPAASVAAGAFLLSPPESSGFTTIGGSLSLSQRDIRILNNFADGTANNNTTADSQFPGYDGAEMAVWKGGVEWGSGLHGNGNGDPHQNGGLGSGGANFDVTWQGNASSAGGANDNIISALSAAGGGVLAFTQTPISDGWTIKFYDGDFNWDDGPGTSISGFDIQGVFCHEYGHALGLGHSNVGGTTMFPAIGGGDVSTRSIAADDVAGVQFVYGVKSGAKPTITAVSVNGSSVTITGVNFSASNNEVWFTKTGSGGVGDPVKVTGVTSDGTSITVTAPGGSGPGDVLVRNNGTGNANLSNAFPANVGGTPPNCGVVSFGGTLQGNTGVLATPSTPTQGSTVTFNISNLTVTGSALLIWSLGTTNQLVHGFTLLVDLNNLVSVTSVALVGGAGSVQLTLPNAPGVTQYFQAAARQGPGMGYKGTNRLDVTICP